MTIQAICGYIALAAGYVIISLCAARMLRNTRRQYPIITDPPLIALLCGHASLGHDFIRTHYIITARIREDTYLVSFHNGFVARVRVVTSPEHLLGARLHSYEVVGPVSPHMIDIARSRIRN